MSPTRIGLLLALLAIGLKLFGFYYQIGGADQGSYFVMLHLLLLLIGAFAGIRMSASDVHSIELFKNGMRAVATYTILYCAYLYVHYKFIDAMYFETRIDEIVQNSPEASRGQNEKNFRSVFTPFNYATITLLGFVASGALYTFLLTVLESKVMRRFKR